MYRRCSYFSYWNTFTFLTFRSYSTFLVWGKLKQGTDCSDWEAKCCILEQDWSDSEGEACRTLSELGSVASRVKSMIYGSEKSGNEGSAQGVHNHEWCTAERLLSQATNQMGEINQTYFSWSSFPKCKQVRVTPTGQCVHCQHWSELSGMGGVSSLAVRAQCCKGWFPSNYG